MPNNTFQKIKNKTQKVYRFINISFLFTFALLLLFLFKASAPETVISSIYSIFLPLYYYVIYFVIMTLLLPVFWIKGGLIFAVIVKTTLDFLLLIDYFVLDVFRFHIDMLFINMFIHDFQGLGVSYGLLAMSFVAFILIGLVNYFFFKKAMYWSFPKYWKIGLFALFGVFTGQAIHAIAFEYKYSEITRFTSYFPYYAPLTSHSTLKKLQKNYPSIFPQKSTKQSLNLNSILTNEQTGLLATPSTQLVFGEKKEKTKQNILIFLVESWRNDSMNQEITPNIHKFSKHSTVFTNHYSSGSVTVSGLFGFMYGLHPSYRKQASTAPFENQSLLTKILEEQGYDIQVYTSSNLDRFSLKEMMFGNIQDENYYNPTSESPDINDATAIKKLITDLSKPSEKPWLKFVFLTATHHSYDYPDEYKKYLPLPISSEAYIFDKHTDDKPFRNDYHNSLLYMDKLFGDTFKALESSEDSHNTFIIVSSDHGEEFNDNKAGYWGHGSNFTNYQISVPMIVKPSKNSTDYVPSVVNNVTGHIDVVPTIFEQILNVTSPIKHYANGLNLLNLPKKRLGLISESYKDKAYIIDGISYTSGLSVDSYSVDDLSSKHKNFDYPSLIELKAEENLFLK